MPTKMDTTLTESTTSSQIWFAAGRCPGAERELLDRIDRGEPIAI